MTDWGYIYFIQSGQKGPIKIGFSQIPVDRMRTIQTAIFEKLYLLQTIIGTRRLEKAIQKRFEKFRTQGEWFEPSEAVLAFINGDRADLPPNDDEVEELSEDEARRLLNEDPFFLQRDHKREMAIFSDHIITSAFSDRPVDSRALAHDLMMDVEYVRKELRSEWEIPFV